MLEIKEEYFGESPYLETMIISKFFFFFFCFFYLQLFFFFFFLFFLLEILTCVGKKRVNAHTVSGTAERKRSKQQQKEYVEKFILVTDYINNHFAEDLSLEGVASLGRIQ